MGGQRSTRSAAARLALGWVQALRPLLQVWYTYSTPKALPSLLGGAGERGLPVATHLGGCAGSRLGPPRQSPCRIMLEGTGRSRGPEAAACHHVLLLPPQLPVQLEAIC